MIWMKRRRSGEFGAGPSGGAANSRASSSRNSGRFSSSARLRQMKRPGALGVVELGVLVRMIMMVVRMIMVVRMTVLVMVVRVGVAGCGFVLQR